ncbi:unnamed protein product, partial [Discosporangium mesarthrocarpum]
LQCRPINFGGGREVIRVGGGINFRLDRELSSSLFGNVFMATCRGLNPDDPLKEGPRVAVKKSSLARMRRNPEENIFKEVAAMRYFQQRGGHRGHPYIMTDVEAYLSREHLYMVTPFYLRGDLLEYVLHDTHGMDESKARLFFRQVLWAVQFMHDESLCHHDISPENILISGDGSHVKLTDLGMCQQIPALP